ncbi:Protein bir1 [Nosema granulosis]|uniref:Protein bir1 n=1 Tax=Nosema granulosis TaxID=83296 RepID=A0A9P6KY74_9MICR|nr:Protein bir1 [Nosema granulosis]
MDSYEERLKTFQRKIWSTEGVSYTPESLAICGFYADKRSEALTVKCFLCKKVLEGWDDTDIPIVEHYNHRRTCIIFSPNLIKSRKGLLGDLPTATELAKRNFVKYNIFKNKPFVFCYKCGCQDTNHRCRIKNQTYKFNPDEESDFFFVNLISGRYINMLNDITNSKISIPEAAREALEALIDELEQFDPSKTLEDFIAAYCESKVRMVEEKMEKDLKEMLK